MNHLFCYLKNLLFFFLSLPKFSYRFKLLTIRPFSFSLWKKKLTGKFNSFHFPHSGVNLFTLNFIISSFFFTFSIWTSHRNKIYIVKFCIQIHFQWYACFGPLKIRAEGRWEKNIVTRNNECIYTQYTMPFYIPIYMRL